VSPNTPKDPLGFKKDDEEDAELSVVSAPIWYVALEAPTTQRGNFQMGFPYIPL